MRYPIFSLVASLALTVSGLAFAQATLPNDDVNIANNPGSVKVPPPVRERLVNCTCQTSGTDNAASVGAGDATVKGGTSGTANAEPQRPEVIRCSCGDAVSETTGTVTLPGSGAEPGAANTVGPGHGTGPSR